MWAGMGQAQGRGAPAAVGAPSCRSAAWTAPQQFCPGSSHRGLAQRPGAPSGSVLQGSSPAGAAKVWMPWWDESGRARPASRSPHATSFQSIRGPNGFVKARSAPTLVAERGCYDRSKIRHAVSRVVRPLAAAMPAGVCNCKMSATLFPGVGGGQRWREPGSSLHTCPPAGTALFCPASSPSKNSKLYSCIWWRVFPCSVHAPSGDR